MPQFVNFDGDIDFTFLGHTASTGAPINFGTPTSNRYLVALVTWVGGTSPFTLSSCSIGGVAATILVQRAGPAGSAICIALVPSGSSGLVTPSLVGGVGTIITITASVYSLIGLISPTPSTAVPSSALNPTASLPVKQGSVALAVAVTGVATAATWTNLTEDSDSQSGPSNVITTSCASASFSAAQTVAVTCTFGGPSGSCGCFVVFDP